MSQQLSDLEDAAFTPYLGSRFIFKRLEEFCEDFSDVGTVVERKWFKHTQSVGVALSMVLDQNEPVVMNEEEAWRLTTATGVLDDAETFVKNYKDEWRMVTVLRAEFLAMAQQLQLLAKELIQGKEKTKEAFQACVDSLHPHTFGHCGSFVPDNDTSFEHQQEAHVGFFLLTHDHMTHCFRALVRIMYLTQEHVYCTQEPRWWNSPVSYPHYFLTQLIAMEKVKHQLLSAFLNKKYNTNKLQ